MRKRLHLTLIVARKNGLVQLPQAITPALPPSPSSFSSSTLSTATSLFSKAHWPHRSGSIRSDTSSIFSSTSSPRSDTFSSPPTSPGLSKADDQNSYGVSLIHATTLSDKATRLLHDTVARASKKFRLGSGWIAPPSTSSALPDDVIRQSLQQNDIVFSNEGLTLLGIDKIYTFKLATAAYMRADGHEERASTLAAAVNELRLLVLTQKGRRISASYLQRSYPAIEISETRLRMINNAYKSEYKSDGVAMNSSEAASTTRTSPMTADTATRIITPAVPLSQVSQFQQRREAVPVVPAAVPLSQAPQLQRWREAAQVVPAAVPIAQVAQFQKRREAVPVVPVMPVTRTRTATTTAIPAVRLPVGRPPGDQAKPFVPKPRTVEARPLTVEEVEILRLSQWLPKGTGPVTPNHYAEVTPITRGEWGMLMGGREGGNLGDVQTC